MYWPPTSSHNGRYSCFGFGVDDGTPAAAADVARKSGPVCSQKLSGDQLEQEGLALPHVGKHRQVGVGQRWIGKQIDADRRVRLFGESPEKAARHPQPDGTPRQQGRQPRGVEVMLLLQFIRQLGKHERKACRCWKRVASRGELDLACLGNGIGCLDGDGVHAWRERDHPQ